MASIWKHPESKFWVACFTGPDGRRMKRSTKTTNRRQAIKLSFKYEEAAGKKLTKKAARQVIGDLYEMVNGEKLPGQTARLFLTEWAYLKKSLVAAGTWRKYNDEVNRFLESLGNKADTDISTINRADVYAFQVTRHILPGPLARPVNDDWFSFQENTISEAPTHFGSDPLIATIAISRESIMEEAQIEAVVERAAQWNVQGYYIVAEAPSPYLVDNPVWVANLLILLLI
jgi:hypothetical protein